MIECGKKETCKNYNKKCSECWANSSLYDTHPCYTSKDLVEVVRCKDCVFSEEDTSACIYCKVNDTKFSKDGFCSYGKKE